MEDNVARPPAVYGRSPDLNGNGVLDSGDSKMGTDTDGDGSWDWVNTSHDFNVNGQPDTGKLFKGQTFKIIVEIEVPASFTGTATDYTNITVTNKNKKASDTATDTTVIPEFELLLVPLVAMIVVFTIFSLKRRRQKNGK